MDLFDLLTIKFTLPAKAAPVRKVGGIMFINYFADQQQYRLKSEMHVSKDILNLWRV